MITIIFPYRNREPERIKKSLDSLAGQTNKNFKVIFIDYGSYLDVAIQIKDLVSNYLFVDYIYNFSEFQPWSRSKAINIGLRKVVTEYVFTADVDIIFRPDFIEKLHEIKTPAEAYYFKVGFLNEKEAKLNKKFCDYIIEFNSGIGAQGLSLFPLKAIKEVNGFDEFLHFWGAEDIDIHDRIKRAGFKSTFYDTENLLLHQWHKSYRSSETNSLTRELQLANIIKLNHYHTMQNDKKEKSVVNNIFWGSEVSMSDFYQLENHNEEIVLLNKIETITHFLYCELLEIKYRILAVRIIEDNFEKSLKYKVKKLLGKKVPQYYTLKEINDMLLLHIISFCHQYPYIYKVSDDLKSIIFRIKK
ncbi:MAG TPA: glycosyltransferase family A protein [Flavobacterium sp.]